MKMAGILLIYILGIYFLLTKMMQLEDEAVVGVKKLIRNCQKLPIQVMKRPFSM